MIQPTSFLDILHQIRGGGNHTPSHENMAAEDDVLLMHVLLVVSEISHLLRTCTLQVRYVNLVVCHFIIQD